MRWDPLGIFLLFSYSSTDMFKVFKHKSGTVAGGGMAEGMNPIQAIQGVLGIITTLMSLMGGCGGEEGGDSETADSTPGYTPPQLQTCADMGGTICDYPVPGCLGGVSATSSDTEGSALQRCCLQGCAQTGSQASSNTELSVTFPVEYVTSIEGEDPKDPCIGQGNKCVPPDKVCPGSEWIQSSDTDYCCRSECVSRLKSNDLEIGLSDGAISVEKVISKMMIDDAVIPIDTYIVWWGKGFDGEHTQYSRCSGTTCTFEAEGSSHTIYITDEGSSLTISETQ